MKGNELFILLSEPTSDPFWKLVKPLLEQELTYNFKSEVQRQRKVGYRRRNTKTREDQLEPT